MIAHLLYRMGEQCPYLLTLLHTHAPNVYDIVMGFYPSL